jgi:hypothetical protein
VNCFDEPVLVAVCHDKPCISMLRKEEDAGFIFATRDTHLILFYANLSSLIM